MKIETGRYQGTLLQDRKCERCSCGEVEDEYHFLFHCNKLANDRNLLATVSLKVVSRKRRRKRTLKSYDRFTNS
jgi:hypothetical protein